MKIMLLYNININIKDEIINIKDDNNLENNYVKIEDKDDKE